MELRVKLVLFAMMAAVLLIAVTLTVYAQERLTCLPVTDLIKHLAESDHEYVVQSGRTSGGLMLMITSSLKGDTWTALMVRGDGIACPVASGFHWRSMEKGA